MVPDPLKLLLVRLLLRLGDDAVRGRLDELLLSRDLVLRDVLEGEGDGVEDLLELGGEVGGEAGCERRNRREVRDIEEAAREGKAGTNPSGR